MKTETRQSTKIPRNVMVLGGYGVTGRIIAREIAKHVDCKLFIAGRNIEKSENLAVDLRRAFPGIDIAGLECDASSRDSMLRALKNIDVLIVAASTTRYAHTVIESAISAEVDYIDIQFSSVKTGILNENAGKIKEVGKTFISESGLTPGLILPVAIHTLTGIDGVKDVVVSSLLNQKEGQPVRGALLEMFDYLKEYKAEIYEKGKWKTPLFGGIFKSRRIHFGESYGKKVCLPVKMEEMRLLPSMYKNLENARFYMAGYNWFADLVAMPLVMLGARLFPAKA